MAGLHLECHILLQAFPSLQMVATKSLTKSEKNEEVKKEAERDGHEREGRERGRDVLREGGCEKHIAQVNSSQLLLHDSTAWCHKSQLLALWPSQMTVSMAEMQWILHT